MVVCVWWDEFSYVGILVCLNWCMVLLVVCCIVVIVCLG